MSLDRLIVAIERTKNPTVVGLDPKLAYVPEHLQQEAFRAHGGETLEAAAAALLAFNKGIIDAIADIVPAIKPQAAYYEMYGWAGMRALEETIAYAHTKGLFVITDAKRGDIGATMEAYTAAHLGTVQVGNTTHVPFGGDALTVNGYLGLDSIQPLLETCRERDTGVFVLAKTSNISSSDLQDLTLTDNGNTWTVYRQMAELIAFWGRTLMGRRGYSGIGAVVGATYPTQLAELREALPHTFFLVPGYGAQGGSAADVVPAFDAQGGGAVVNNSRGIICAWQRSGGDGHDYAEAAREATIKMRDMLRQEIPGLS